MRRGRRMRAIVLATAAALLLTGTASAATPRQIYRDYADNGRLDHTYSQSDLRAALRDALLQGYGGTASSGLKPAVQKRLVAPSGGGVLGARKTKQASPGAPMGVAAARPTLPFTGIDLALIAAGGGLLLLVGSGLRRAGSRA